MNRLLSVIKNFRQKQKGFTLVEMVTVVAVMGVIAAVAVPMVNNQLGKTREKSYAQDKAMIQTAVDSFFTAADNVRYLGQRQFHLLGNSKSTGSPDTWPQQIEFDGAGTPALDRNVHQTSNTPPPPCLSPSSSV